MFERNLFTKNAAVTTIAVISILSMTSCSKKGDNTTNVTPQGTVQLDTIKAGLPESTFKDASLTFVPDTKAAATSGGKTQYVSRTYNTKKGQYIANCKDGKCFVLTVLYAGDAAVAKEDALETLKQIIPADAVESKVDDSLVKDPKVATEIHEYGEKYTGTLKYSAKDPTKVEVVSAMDLPPAQVHELLTAKPKSPGKGKGDTAKGGKNTKVKEAAKPAAEAAPPATDTTTSTSTTP